MMCFGLRKIDVTDDITPIKTEPQMICLRTDVGAFDIYSPWSRRWCFWLEKKIEVADDITPTKAELK